MTPTLGEELKSTYCVEEVSQYIVVMRLEYLWWLDSTIKLRSSDMNESLWAAAEQSPV